MYVDNRLFSISIKAFICDRPGRSFMKNMKNHGGYYACERCTVPGTRFEKRMIYPTDHANCQPRTDESFRLQSNKEHHLGLSPLIIIKPKIDMVYQLVLDSMHLLFLGVMKKLLECWLEGNNNKKLKISNAAKIKLSDMLIKIKVPAEFQRSTRSLVDVHKFKSTEFQFILLYAGPVLFKKILPENIYKHFLLLHVGCRILCSKELAVKKVTCAREMLQTFVNTAPSLYGMQFLVGNIHNLIHIADDVQYMQCSLLQMASYPFENLLGNKPLPQLCRRVSELSTRLWPKPSQPPTIKILKETPANHRGRIIIKRLKFKNVLLTNKFPENIVLLKTKEIVEIKKKFRNPENDAIEIIKSCGKKVNTFLNHIPQKG